MEFRDLALKLLARKDKSAYEVEQYLFEKGANADEANQVLVYLAKMKYLDDEGYCLRYLEKAIGKGKAITRAQFELQERGIPADLINDALEKLEIEDRQIFEKETAYRQAKKLLENQHDLENIKSNPADFKRLKRKMAGKLASKGFGGEVVYDVLGRLLGDELWEQ